MQLSNEHKILALVANGEIEAGQIDNLCRLMSADISADKLVALAIKEGLAGILYKQLQAAGLLAGLDEQLVQHLESAYYLTFSTNLKMIRALKDILRGLDQEDIQIVLLQGIGLLAGVYTDIGCRPMRDMDLWVLPDDFDRFCAVLVKLGYVGNSQYPNLFKKGDILIDIHTQLLWAERIKSRTMLLDIAQENLFDRSVPVTMEGQSALVLNSQDHFLYLSMHVLKHNAERLIRLTDIRKLCAEWSTAEWNALLARADELGQGSVVGYIIYLMERLIGFDLPHELKPHFAGRRPGRFERAILRKRDKRDSLPIWSSFLLFSKGKKVSKRLSFIWENMFPDPHVLRQVFSDHSGCKDWQLYGMRVLQMMGFGKP